MLNDDRRENLIGRTFRPSEELLRVGNVEGDWHAELKIPQRNIGQIRRAFADPSYHKIESPGPAPARSTSTWTCCFAASRDTSYRGRLYEDDVAAQAVPNKNEHDETEPVVTAYVKLNLPDDPAGAVDPRRAVRHRAGGPARIRCGDHALGYSMFHGVWEWFYEKVVFFF